MRTSGSMRKWKNKKREKTNSKKTVKEKKCYSKQEVEPRIHIRTEQTRAKPEYNQPKMWILPLIAP